MSPAPSQLDRTLQDLCRRFNFVRGLPFDQAGPDLLKWTAAVLSEERKHTSGPGLHQAMLYPGNLAKAADGLCREISPVLRQSGAKDGPSEVWDRLAQFIKSNSGLDRQTKLIYHSLVHALEVALNHPSHRLVTYGTLAPGRKNHHIVQNIAGTWKEGTVRGHLKEQGWGAQDGFPALALDETGPGVPAYVLTSSELPQHWERLDEFEGEEYGRVIVPVVTANEIVACNIYALADQPSHSSDLLP